LPSYVIGLRRSSVGAVARRPSTASPRPASSRKARQPGLPSTRTTPPTSLSISWKPRSARRSPAFQSWKTASRSPSIFRMKRPSLKSRSMFLRDLLARHIFWPPPQAVTTARVTVRPSPLTSISPIHRPTSFLPCCRKQRWRWSAPRLSPFPSISRNMTATSTSF
jgi:hypothetical protein